jgi:hypothetical protein
MNNLIRLPVVTITTSIILLLANITLWSSTVILLTILAVPSFIMWVVGAYLMSYLALSTSGLKAIPKHLLPKLPHKPKRVRMH